MDTIQINPTQHEILKSVWLKEHFARQELSEDLNIDKSTVSRNLESLISQGLVLEAGEKNPGESGGRKTQILNFNKDYFNILGIAVVNGRALYTINDMQGNVLFKDSIRFEKKDGEFFRGLDSVIELALKNYGNILAICISMPGIIDSAKGYVVFSEDLELKNLNLKKYVENKYKIYTFIENDANSGVASYLSHFRLKYSNLIYFMFFFPDKIFKFGGLGAGIVIDKKIYRGSNSAAGEIKFEQELWFDKEKLYSIKDINTGFRENPEIMDVLNRITDMLSNRIYYLTNFLDPDHIILGGDINQFSEEVKNYLMSKIFRKFGITESNTFILVDAQGLVSIAAGGTISFMNAFMSDFAMAKKILKFGL